MTTTLTYDEFTELVNTIDQSNPSPEELLAIRKALVRNPEVIAEVSNLARMAQHIFILQSELSPVFREFFKAGMKELERELGYEESPMLERLAIDQVLLCYMRLNHWEQCFSTFISQGGKSLKQLQQWEKLISSAQKRYLRAVEALARIRRLGISIQVNIATEGGQQINLNRS